MRDQPWIHCRDGSGYPGARDCEPGIDYNEALIILAAQLLPSLLVDVLKFCMLRHLGFDVMAFWKGQKNPRRQLGKIVASVYSSSVVLLLLLNRENPQMYFINDDNSST